MSHFLRLPLASPRPQDDGMKGHDMNALTRNIIALTVASLTIGSALADGTAPLADPRARLRAPDGQAATDAGLITWAGPGYPGGKNRSAGLAPYVEANLANGVFFSARDGIGFHSLNYENGAHRLDIGVSLGISGSRKERAGRDGARNPLKGMGDITPRAQTALFADYSFHRFHASATLQQEWGDRQGTGLELAARYDALRSVSDLVQIGASMHYADQEMMQTYFGVTPRQAAASGHSVHRPDAGIGSYGVNAGWRHAFGSNWLLHTELSAMRLAGDAGSSPLTERKTDVLGTLAVGYRF